METRQQHAEDARGAIGPMREGLWETSFGSGTVPIASRSMVAWATWEAESSSDASPRTVLPEPIEPVITITWAFRQPPSVLQRSERAGADRD
jgi:hypothetical protein